MSFPKNFNPQECESQWYQKWEQSNVFTANNKSTKPKYSILMPPPNVTGILHFGHVLNHTLQDLYIRRKRMQGYEVCWFPGLDHAGIATQSRVEKELKATENKSRYDYGREPFIEKVWDWKEKYGGIILKQLRTLGVSCDWSRTLFTMDDSASKLVEDVFISLFDKGYIYKGKRIINWSPVAQTALSDEEVEFREVNEHFYTLRYHFEDGSGFLKVGTVRPETIYGDVAIAVNPKDERYKELIGKKVIVPMVNRAIPIITDDYADPEFGTGCVKITPAHDPNDFEVGLRNNLEMINTINPDGTLNELTGEFNGIERFEARKKFVEKLKELDLIEEIKDYSHNVGFSQRGGEPIEPYLSDQWFVKMKPLAEEALKAVVDEEIRFYPSHWTKTYERWMNNIRDWCISRQLWWGHRIPVYYSDEGKFTAAKSEEEARIKLGLTNDAALTRDEDVLDTWFSSWLWPLSTMRWQIGDDETDDTRAFLPSDLLVTGPDIIFFWVARMVMATKEFKGLIPFKDVYFTSMIRDGQGRKLSKSLGNSPDPLNIIDKYGADSVRFTMIYLSPLGQDVRMDVDVNAQDIPSMEIGRNFINKVWNAGRFLMMKKEELGENYIHKNDTKAVSIADKWILSQLNKSVKQIDESLDNYRVNDYSKNLYDFIRGDFCDWYVEIFKYQFNSYESIEQKNNLLNFALNIYAETVKLLHPVCPFITEEIWSLIKNDDSLLISSNVTIFNEIEVDIHSTELFDLAKLTIEEFRKLRAEANIPPSKAIDCFLVSSDNSKLASLNLICDLIGQLTKVSNIIIANSITKPEFSVSSSSRGIEFVVTLDDTFDPEKEKEKLNKEIERLTKQVAGIKSKLSNEKFVSGAPESVVANEKKKLEDMSASLKMMQESLAKLS